MEDSIIYYTETIKTHPNNPRAYFYRDRCYYNL